MISVTCHLSYSLVISISVTCQVSVPCPLSCQFPVDDFFVFAENCDRRLSDVARNLRKKMVHHRRNKKQHDTRSCEVYSNFISN